MEYVQERITTLHDFGGADPDVAAGRATVVVPMTARDHASLATERVFTELERVGPDHVVVALRAASSQVENLVSWVGRFDLDATVLWCSAPDIESYLADNGLGGETGKGRDVWLALGLAADSDYVVVHDADAKTYRASHVRRLLYPLTEGKEFVKGYYARVENSRLYGRLFRLLYAPIVRALRERHEAPILPYLDAFRYALAGEVAATGTLIETLRVPRGWGLEVATIGGAFEAAGFEGTAQVDLGIHEHDHRSVGGSEGLGDMSREVGAALFDVLESAGVDPNYETLPPRYRNTARRFVDQYAADAGFNGLEYDPGAEREQIDTYAGAIQPPATDDWLPAWEDAPIDPQRLRSLSAAAIESPTER